jgi:hypothetical protein
MSTFSLPAVTNGCYCRRELIGDMDVTNVGHLSVVKSRPFTELNFDFVTMPSASRAVSSVSQSSVASVLRLICSSELE